MVFLYFENMESIFYYNNLHAKIEELKPGQDPEQEVVSELVSCVLASMYGIDKKSPAWTYIQLCTRKNNQQVGKTCLSVLHEVEKVLDLILGISK